MVFYFISQGKSDLILVDSNVLIYMGKDKFENEKLIEFAWPEDIWFHVKSMSSAHVYLRLQAPIDDLSQIPKDLVRECAHLVKAHSIEGVKKKEVLVNYTPAMNLLKTEDMSIGAVSFKNPKNVATIEVGKNRDLVKALLKVKKEEFPNLEGKVRLKVDMRKQRDSKEMKLLKAKRREEILAQRQLEKKKEEMKKQEEDDFAELQDPSAMVTNQYKGDLVDDFW